MCGLRTSQGPSAALPACAKSFSFARGFHVRALDRTSYLLYLACPKPARHKQKKRQYKPGRSKKKTFFQRKTDEVAARLPRRFSKNHELSLRGKKLANFQSLSDSSQRLPFKNNPKEKNENEERFRFSSAPGRPNAPTSWLQKKQPQKRETKRRKISYSASAWPAKRPDFLALAWDRQRKNIQEKKMSPNHTWAKRCKVDEQARKVVLYWAQRPAGQTSRLCCWSRGRGEGQEIKKTLISKRDVREFVLFNFCISDTPAA
jgi:hypothetical protein